MELSRKRPLWAVPESVSSQPNDKRSRHQVLSAIINVPLISGQRITRLLIAVRDHISNFLNVKNYLTSAKTSSQFDIIRSKLKRLVISLALNARRLLSVSSLMRRFIAHVSESVSSLGINIPSTPLVIISRGPLGHSVEITGKPQAIASQRAFGKPSNREDITNRSAWLRISCIALILPGKKTPPSSPNLSRRASSWPRKGP